ncbi:MAG: deoxyribodipyrimidine photo-lyase [Bacteroidetes bacterium]|nr:deoxyribodipyrimidine photo-lyase [Bacteroidota bacterium]
MHYIYWFRKDLRLTDNHALARFLKDAVNGSSFSFIYIKNNNSYRYFGEKRIVFLIQCLEELKQDLSDFKSELQIFSGKSIEVFKNILLEKNPVSVYLNEQVEPYCRERDESVRKLIEDSGGIYNSFTDSTIFSPGEIKNGEGHQYKVFTPFKNNALSILTKDHYKKHVCDFSNINNKNEIIFKSQLKIKQDKKISGVSGSVIIKGGRKEGLSKLRDFYETKLNRYNSQRDFPSLNATSRLSAHLHFGTIGIREALRTAFAGLSKSESEKDEKEVQTWINELLWREFYYHITFHNPRLTYQSFKTEYDDLNWNYDESNFRRWAEGKTGYPIVDAGMRQLNKEGWMHNRVRMITAMFLTKDLFIDWRLGEKYFAEKLIDLDFSSNNGGWQWSASTGVDAQPYFRIFNPYLQSKKFDPAGDYIRKYVPELSSLPVEFIHEPNIMNHTEQEKYRVIIGKDYPNPVIDHKAAKDIAIRNFKKAAHKL